MLRMRTESSGEEPSGIGDDRLRLIFTCCHPALPIEAQVALTLRALAGLTTQEIARAFLVPQETMAKRLTRAKRKIEHASIPYRVPPAHQLAERLRAVLAVIYALFNEGYGASSGAELIRRDLCTEAIRLGRVLAELMPDEPEVLGLVSLMLLHDSRRGARLDTAGDLVTLEEQDRSLWHKTTIEAACKMLDRAMRHRRPGPYQLLAAIAAVPRAGPDCGGHRLARDRSAVRAAQRALALPRRCSKPSGRCRDGPRTGGRTGNCGRTRASASAASVPPGTRDPRRSTQTHGPQRGSRRGI